MLENPLAWRLLRDGIQDPFLHFAIEETLLRRVAENRSEPTLRLRRVVPSVFIGVYQDPREDVAVEECSRRGIPIVRRPNPGGAVYQDQGSFCYSAFFPKQPSFRAFGIQSTRDLYGLLGEVVVAFCHGFGVAAQAAPVNDVEVGGRKVYGSAQVELGDGVVHSGTFLIHTDIDVMEAVLRPSRLKFAGKGFTDVRSRVLNLSEASGRPVSIQEAMDAFVQAFQARLPVRLHSADLTQDELDDAQELHRIKYGTAEWNFPNRSRRSVTVATKALSGVVAMDLDWDGARIDEMDIRGDFLVECQGSLSAFVQGARGCTVREAQALLRESAIPSDLAEALSRLMRQLSGDER